MVIKTTQWSPDTCGCVFEYEWDDAQNEDTRVHNFKQVTKECASHAHLQGNNKKDMYDSSLEENRRKNGTIQELLERAGVEFADTQQDGSVTLKKNINVSWTWSGSAPDRIMTLTVTGITLTNQRKTQIQNFLNNKFGNGKVVFVNS
jgi:hypothetical protein